MCSVHSTEYWALLLGAVTSSEKKFDGLGFKFPATCILLPGASHTVSGHCVGGAPRSTQEATSPVAMYKGQSSYSSLL